MLNLLELKFLLFEFLLAYDSILWEQQDGEQFSVLMAIDARKIPCNDVTWLEEHKLSKLYINLNLKYLLA